MTPAESAPSLQGRTSVSPLRRNALLTASGVALSRITGLLREQTMAFLFGASPAVEAFVAAFRIPNFFRDLLAENISTSAVVPVYTRIREQKGREAAAEFAGAALALVLTAATAITLAGMIFAGPICKIVAAGFTGDPAKFQMTVELTRWLFPILFLVATAAFLQAIQNAENRFFMPAFATAGMNLGFIICGWVLSRVMDPPILGMAVGVLCGGGGALMLLWPGYRRVLPSVRLRSFRGREDVKIFLGLVAPLVVGVAATNVNVLVNTLLATFAEPGALAWLNYSYRIMHLPLGLVAVSLATAALPALSQAWHRGDRDRYARLLGQAFIDTERLALPAAAGMIFLAGDLIAGLYQYGRFTAADTAMTALTLVAYASGLPAYSGNRILSAAFYARQTTKLPVMIGLAGISVNIILNLTALAIGWGATGIAASTAAAGWFQTAVYLHLLFRLEPALAKAQWGRAILPALVATLVMLAALYWVAGAVANLPAIVRLAIECATGVIVYGGLMRMRRRPS